MSPHPTPTPARTPAVRGPRTPGPGRAALRAGGRRGLIELRQSFTNGADLVSHFLWPVLLLVALFLLRDREFGAEGIPFGTFALPGILGMNIAMGMVSMSQILTADREDGTLLRARATPYGLRGFITGKVVSVGGGLLADLAILLVPGLLIVDGLTVDGTADRLTLLWAPVLGMLATLPVGAVLGSLAGSARAQGLVQLPVLGMIAVSGIFHPVTALPEWLQWTAQLTPVYWLGLAMRSVFLPDEAAAAEIGGSWRLWEAAGVLGLWAVLGLLVAPVVLRRAARRESGSNLSDRRERALRRSV
ncbi:ABC transporter permease [Streptomyces qinzhouensis]|uniref:Transport permease protein n=1 Tax=Streptomyces qinzhouensis TaxID=2599401 RepID=A0A5B8JI52_9ACTN|nr:ABC transporter permease [Streptomyces qinzhouensis]QDY77193.1 ABC transporter permease [Streptomyces qinzhouensis]